MNCSSPQSILAEVEEEEIASSSIKIGKDDLSVQLIDDHDEADVYTPSAGDLSRISPDTSTSSYRGRPITIPESNIYTESRELREKKQQDGAQFVEELKEHWTEERIDEFDVGHKTRETSIISLTLHTISRRLLPTTANPNPKRVVVTRLRVSFNPATIRHTRFRSANLVVQFTTPTGVKVIDFAPDWWSSNQTTINRGRNFSASLAGTVPVPPAIALTPTLQVQWNKNWRYQTMSNITGTVSHNFSRLSYNFGEDSSSPAGLDRIYEISFQLNCTGEVKGQIWLTATIVDLNGLRLPNTAEMKIGSEEDAKPFEFNIPIDTP